MGQFTLNDIRKINELVNSRRELFNNTQDIQSMYEASKNMYSDDSAFVLELIQNADDCSAKEVIIELTSEKFTLKHDGRCFELNDIEQITKASQINNEKSNDDSKIGQFGIGFKSVFNITNKPQITSGKYCFEIKDFIIPKFLVPDTDGDSSDLTYNEYEHTNIELYFNKTEVFEPIKERLESISSSNLDPMSRTLKKRVTLII